jgi:hypothetical protein
MPKQSSKTGLRGAEKCANSEEFRRLMNVRRGEDPCFMEEKSSKDILSEERRRAVSEKLARKRGFL